MMIRETLNKTVFYFRVGMDGAANSELITFVDELVKVIEKRGKSAENLLPALNELLSAQKRADTLRVADLLQYEIAPYID